MSHRDSALFLRFNPKPLDDWQPPHWGDAGGSKARHAGSAYEAERHRRSMMDGQGPGGTQRRSSDLKTLREDLDRVPEDGTELGRARTPSGGWNEPLNSGRYPLNGPQLDGPGTSNTHFEAPMDVSSWDIPQHLSSPSIPDATDQATSSPRIPVTSLSPSLVAPHFLPPLQTANLSVPAPITSPLQGRATSIHLDVGSGIHDHASLAETMETLKESDPIEEAIRQAERVREKAERVMQSPRLIPLPPSPATTLHSLSNRPRSSLSFVYGSLSRPTHDCTNLPGDDELNPFALPSPPPRLGSRFDPKMLSEKRHQEEIDFGPIAHRERQPESSFQAVEAQNIADDRPISRVWDEIPTLQEFGRPLRPNRYSAMPPRADRASLIRPQTVVMPRPLSETFDLSARSPPVPDGYTIGDKPLPSGSRSSILSIGNTRPHIPMSLSQRTFRDSLLYPEEEGDLDNPDRHANREEALGPEEMMEDFAAKTPGKLYGTSLMDKLEARKAAMRLKQRVFTGDSRPAMMARSSQYDLHLAANNAIADEDHIQPLSAPPRHSLAQMPSNGNLQSGSLSRIRKSTSVFGVDQLWEKELGKLKVMQEQEARRIQAEEATREAVGGLKGKKDKGKGRATVIRETDRIERVETTHADAGNASSPMSPIKRTPMEPPRVSYSPAKSIPPGIPYLASGRQRAISALGAGWSSDEDEDHEGANGPRTRAPSAGGIGLATDTDSEEDAPLSRLVAVASRTTHPRAMPGEDDSDDEDVPLSKLNPSKTTSSIATTNRSATQGALPSITLDSADFGSGSLGLVMSDDPAHSPAGADEDDDVPLALRWTRIMEPPQDTEDDVPLGYKRASAWVQPHDPARDGYSQKPIWPSMPIFSSVPYGMGSYPSFTGSPYPGLNQGPGYTFPSMPSVPNLGYGGTPYYPQGAYVDPRQSAYGYGHMGEQTWQDDMGAPMEYPPPQEDAARNINSWRNDVAVAPAGSSNGSARGKAVS